MCVCVCVLQSSKSGVGINSVRIIKYLNIPGKEVNVNYITE